MGGITEINAMVSPSGGWIDQLTIADVQPTKRGGKICATKKKAHNWVITPHTTPKYPCFDFQMRRTKIGK